MDRTTLHRHIPLTDLDFRGFWDICTHFQRHFPDFPEVTFTIETAKHDFVVLEEGDLERILRKLRGCPERLRRFQARFHSRADSDRQGPGFSNLTYLPVSEPNTPAGLHLQMSERRRLPLYQFESGLFANYPVTALPVDDVAFGQPCEVLAASIDLRGFSLFCEQPNIESPYTSGLMSAFYGMVDRALYRYPPDIVKVQGDGVLAIWQTGYEDRGIAVEHLLRGCLNLSPRWETILAHPRFSHGAPREIGVGIAFGLASLMTTGDDFLGRPINLASRLCSACPGGEVYVDRGVPDLPPDLDPEDTAVAIRSFGRFPIRRLRQPQSA
ncbi:MAG: adenylate/guanylate cyclase domain-containing protein [Opitutales bacterium]